MERRLSVNSTNLINKGNKFKFMKHKTNNRASAYNLFKILHKSLHDFKRNNIIVEERGDTIYLLL